MQDETDFLQGEFLIIVKRNDRAFLFRKLVDGFRQGVAQFVLLGILFRIDRL